MLEYILNIHPNMHRTTRHQKKSFICWDFNSLVIIFFSILMVNKFTILLVRKLYC